MGLCHLKEEEIGSERLYCWSEVTQLVSGEARIGSPVSLVLRLCSSHISTLLILSCYCFETIYWEYAWSHFYLCLKAKTKSHFLFKLSLSPQVRV